MNAQRSGLPLAICALLGIWGGSLVRSAHADQANNAKAWFDARSVCIFPLRDGRLPRSRDELDESLTRGWDKAMQVPDASKLVQIQGEGYPALESLRIDLSDATMPNGKAEKVQPNNRPQTRLGVERFELVGEPLLCRQGRLNLTVSAADAHLDLERDRRGKPIMLLAEAKDANLTFEATGADLQRILLADLRAAASPFGVDVISTSLHLTSDSDRSVSVDLQVLTKFALIPAGMHFKAHVDIDDNMNAKLTGLSCDGDQVLGPLIVGLIRPGLAKYDGRSRPLISFPSGKMHLRDVRIRVDDSVHLNAAFGT
jgi:hypothetical protein